MNSLGAKPLEPIELAKNSLGHCVSETLLCSLPRDYFYLSDRNQDELPNTENHHQEGHQGKDFAQAIGFV